MKYSSAEIIKNIIVGLAVSIVMLNLGAALGILSGRGAFPGMLSAGMIALITSLFGGTRIQGSGCTAPMSTVTAVIVAYAAEQLPQEIHGYNSDHFVNIVLLLTAILLVLFGIFRLGRFIRYVPNLVISGFMCGIALIIWILQYEILFGVGRDPLAGPTYMNLLIAFSTFTLAFLSQRMLKLISPTFAMLIPGTLVALITVSLGVNLMNLPVAYLEIGTSINSANDLLSYINSQIPAYVSVSLIMLALPFAIKLAALCYIDTLLTSLIIDKLSKEKTRQNKELIAQGMATGAISILGGVPGAQSTVPSVLTIKEGATMRLAGVCAGLFVIMGMLMLSDIMNYIPQAVFVGILVKVGYDVFDFKPIWGYVRTLRRTTKKLPSKILGHKEMTFLSGTAVVTAFIDLIVAVGTFTLGYHIVNKLMSSKSLNDYIPT
jgi:SulP family sulfate permease